MEREHRLKKDNLSVGFVQLASFPQEIGTFEEKKSVEEEEEEEKQEQEQRRKKR